MALAISHQLKIFVCILEVYKTADLQTTATLKATRYFQAPTNSCGSNISFEHVNILLESFPSASKYNHHILEEYNALYTSERNYIFHVKKKILVGMAAAAGWLPQQPPSPPFASLCTQANTSRRHRHRHHQGRLSQREEWEEWLIRAL